MNKQLAIQIKLSDSASAGIRQVMNRVAALGTTAVRTINSIAGGLGGLIRRLTSFRTLAIAAFAAIGTGALANSIRKTAKEMDELVKTSRQLGLSAQFLGELKYTADLSGVSFESLSNASARLARSVAEVVDKGAGPAYEAFRGLGVQLRNSQGQLKPMNELLYEITDRFTALEDGYKRVQYAQGIFGKGGTEMLRVLALGSPALRQMAEEARRLGAVFSDQELAAAEAFNDSISRIGFAITGLKGRIVGLMGEDLAGWLNKVASGIAALPEIVKNISDVIRQAIDPQGEQGHYIRQSVLDLFSSISWVAEVGIKGILRVSVAALMDSIDAIRITVAPRVMSLVDDLAIDTATRFASKTMDVLAATISQAVPQPLRRFTEEWESSLRTMARGAEVMSGPLKQVLRLNEGTLGAVTDSFDQNLSSVSAKTNRITDAFRRFYGDMSAQVGVTIEMTDALFGISEALAKTALNVGGLSSSLSNLNGNVTATVSNLTAFRNGSIDAFEAARTAADDFNALGSSVTTELTQGLSQQLAPAIVDIATTWKLSTDSIRQSISNVLRSVSEMIAQMLVLRAVVGIGDAISGGLSGLRGAGGGNGVNTGLNSLTDGGVPNLSGLLDGVFANKGLREVPRITIPAGVAAAIAAFTPQYASGTSSVPGPYTNRDSVLAMLTPRESVLTPRASDMLGRGNIDRLNRGESIGGHTYAPVINISVNVSGQGNAPERTAQAVSREVEAAVLRALATSPSFRQEMRRHL